MAITIISNREDYLDRIARREFAPSKNNPIALGVLAESIEHPLIRDLYFDRTPNEYEQRAWINVADLAESNYAKANAWCLAAFHSDTELDINYCTNKALEADPTHKLAGQFLDAINLGLADRLQQAAAEGGHKARTIYEAKTELLIIEH